MASEAINGDVQLIKGELPYKGERRGGRNMAIAVNMNRSRSHQLKHGLLLTSLLLIMIVLLPGAPALAQEDNTARAAKLLREGRRLLKSDVEQLESSLKDHPDAIEARTRLLGFYFHSALPVYGREATIEARRRHILWLIEHDPGSSVLTLGEATIDANGHALADPAGYELASAAWTEQTKMHAQDIAVLQHAAKFFQLSDKDRAASLLKNAQAIQPDNRDLPAFRGYVYALGILGVTMMNQNGLPTAQDPAEAENVFAKRAARELSESSDAVMVGVAGQIIGQYGVILSALDRGTNRFTVDYAPLAETLLTRAQALEPANPHWQQQLELLRKLRSPAGAPQ
ncbi:MAG: hypothetical protein WBX25_12700 [Rhodomicrobium sp.]